jgi:hypothetical protein
VSWDVITGAAAHAALVAWIVALAMLPFAVYVGIALHGRWVSRHPTSDGRAPLNHPLAVRYYDVKALEARRGWLPESFTYSPHTRNEQPVVDPEGPIALPAHAMTLEQVLGLGGICYGSRVDTGEPLLEQRVLSLAVGGRPGSGKSNTVALLALQYSRDGAELYLSDPHVGHPDSLVNRLGQLTKTMCDTPRPHIVSTGDSRIAETPRETLHLLERALSQLESRKRLWRASGGSDKPLVAIVDEWPETLRTLPPRDRERLLDVVQLIGYAGRKYGVAVLLVAQSWLVPAVGSSQVRNPLRAAIVHAMRADEARALAGLPAAAWPADPAELVPGEAFVCGVDSGITRVRMPLVDVPLLGARPVLALPSSVLADGDDEHTASTPRALNDDPKRAQILELARRGVEPKEIVRLVYGLEKTGAAYTARMREVWAIVSGAVRDD